MSTGLVSQSNMYARKYLHGLPGLSLVDNWEVLGLHKEVNTLVVVQIHVQ